MQHWPAASEDQAKTFKTLKLTNMYAEIKGRQPVMIDCFFAFSNEQLETGIEKHNLKGRKLISAGHGLFGTKEGIDKFISYYDNLSTEISEKCNPQEVYDYEYWNHECGYTCTDTEAIEIVVGYFGVERAKEVKRKYGYADINTFSKV